MRKIYFFILSVFAISSVRAQSFSATYDFTLVTTTSGTTDPTPPPTGAGLSFGSFNAVGTPANPNATIRFSFVDWSLSGINTAEYYQVTLTPAANYSIDLNTITFTLQRSGTGIRHYSIRSSIDAYAANQPASISPANANLTVIPTDVFEVADIATAQVGSTVTLGASFDNLSGPVTFRFYGWDAEASGGTFSIDNVVFNGVSTFTGSTNIFYSKPAGNLTDVATWGNVLDGSGSSPTDFTTDGQIFNVVNRVTTTLDANWIVSGASSKVVVGDGLSGTTLILPAAAALTGTADVSNLSTLQIINTSLPTYGTLSLGSTVDYAQTAPTYVVPTGTTYHHLKLTGNIKTFASGTVAVNGNFTIDGVTGFNGSATPFSTLSLGGNFSLTNSAAFEPIATGDGNRMTITCTGSGLQTFSGGDFYIFRLQTPASGPVVLRLSSANMTLGNASGGGLDLRGLNHFLQLGGNTLTIHRSGFISATNTGLIDGGGGNLVIDKTSGTGTSPIGSIGFLSAGETLNDFYYNCTIGSSTTLNISTSAVVVMGTLSLINGKINSGGGTMWSGGTVIGGSSTSYVQFTSAGIFKLLNVTGSRFAPIGSSTYNPLTVNNTSGHDWSLRVEDVLTVNDPAFASNAAKAVQREWHITPSVNPPATGATITFQWDDSDPTQIGGSYNNAELVQVWHEVANGNPYGNDWIAAGVSQLATGTPPGVRTASISNWTWYSPFAISNISGPLPIKLISFNAVKTGVQRSLITWELAACCSREAKFEIQRSLDGRNYSSIATVTGSETNRFYVYHDNNLAKGINYYRLKGIDADGKISYSRIIVVINDTQGLLITSLMSNPVNDAASLIISSAKAGPVNFVIYDLSGRPVHQWQTNITEGSNTVPVNAGKLPAGIYHLAATAEEMKTVIRFVKQ